MEKIWYKRKSEKEFIKYQAELEWYMDSLYELLTTQEPKLWRQIMDTFSSILYWDAREWFTWDDTWDSTREDRTIPET